MDELLNHTTFKELPHYPGYRFGSDGSIWSRWSRVGASGRYECRDWKLLRGGTDKDGYRKVILVVNGKRFYRRVHRLILEAFVGPPPHGCIAAHHDGNNRNNTISNLRWCSQKENILDKERHGTAQRGEQ